ncbi:hypothetical protein BD779DRAFT_1433414 [Infundibulicybe gibba]|nr:hypothetical protein BD779DRAFT_1433414 [Infundibulicybe gibba]
MDASSPPHYRRYSSRPGPAPQSGGLPPYTRRNTLAQPVAHRQPTEHVFYAEDSKGRPWATLKVHSSAKSSKSLPTFFEKENINGSLTYLLRRGIPSMLLRYVWTDSFFQISGRIITGASADDSFTFLNIHVPIWSKSLSVPRLPSQSPAHWPCSWDISIPLPKSISLPGDAHSSRLPETFLERHTRASVQYDLTIHISRGKLRSDSRIKTAFGYVPSTRPDPPSLLRQLAYEQCCPLPGPEIDPMGWKTLRPVTARGTMFKSRTVEARCTLSLAKPLCYTRGSVIPCFLSLEGQDSNTLDLLSTPSSIFVSLRRRVRFYNNTGSARHDVAWTESVEDVGSAVWWAAANPASNAYARHLEGEISLAKDLRPSSAMGHFSITYSVVLCPFDAANFTSDSASLLSEPVEIATMHAKAPRPVAYAPPAYDQASRTNNEYYATMRGTNVHI